MKKVLKLGALAILAFAMLFTVVSCSDDDDDDAPAVPTLTPLEKAKADYTAKVAELNAAKTAKLASVTTVVYGTVTEADKFEVPFGGKYITKGDLKTYTDLLAKTVDEVATGADDTAKTTAVTTATTALDAAKTAFENAIITLDAKWNADHFWATSGAYNWDQITGKNCDKKVAGDADGVSSSSTDTYKSVTLAKLGYTADEITAFNNSDTVTCKTDDAALKGYYDATRKIVKFWKSRSATGYVTEFDSDGKVTRIKIVQTINDAIANIGNGVKASEVSWYTTWAATDDFPGTADDIKAGMMQYNVDFRFAGKLQSKEGVDSDKTDNCSGLALSDATDGSIKLVRLADNSGKKVTGSVACGGGTVDTNKTYTQGAAVYGGEIAETDTKIPIVAGKTSVYKVTLQKDADKQDEDGVQQGEGLIMDFEVNINAAKDQPFADYQFRE